MDSLLWFYTLIQISYINVFFARNAHNRSRNFSTSPALQEKLLKTLQAKLSAFLKTQLLHYFFFIITEARANSAKPLRLLL